MAAKGTDWRPGPAVCRCCFAEGCYKDISTEYFWMGKREVYSEMLSTTFDVSIAYSQSTGPNSNSRLICEPCISRLRDASDFKRQVVECEKTFMQHLDPGSSNTMDLEIHLEAVEKEEVKLERVKVETKVSDDEFDDGPGFPDDDDDDLDDEPLTKLASKVPKKETVDFLDLLDNSKPEKRKATTKPKAPPAKKPKKREAPKASASKPPAKPEKKKKGPVFVKKWVPRRKYGDQRDNAVIIFQCSNVCPFRWKHGAYTCAYCPKKFGDFPQLKEHTVEHPNRVEVMRYARPLYAIKVDITDLRCTICPEPLEDIDALANHLITVHQKPIVKDHELGVMPFLLSSNKLVCIHCQKQFELFTNLNSHMNEHNSINICFQCGKSFTAVSRLNTHLKIHEAANNANNGQYKCSNCYKTFASKILREQHLLTHHKEKRNKCPLCNEYFKAYHERMKHLEEYHGKKVEFACHICPAKFALCSLRNRHIRQVHIQKKQFTCELCAYQFVTAAHLKEHIVRHGGERKFQCEVCKKAYARKKTLKEHMRIHNNDKRFSCEYCNYACDQKCSLKSHMKSHHPNDESLNNTS